MHTEQKNNKKLKELYQVRGRGGWSDHRLPGWLAAVCLWRCSGARCLPAHSIILNHPAPSLPPHLRPHAESAGHQVGHPAPPHHGRHPRVRRQDAHARARVGRCSHRLLRGLQVVRRGVCGGAAGPSWGSGKLLSSTAPWPRLAGQSFRGCWGRQLRYQVNCWLHTARPCCHLTSRLPPAAPLLPTLPSRRAAAGVCSASSTWCWPTC